MIIAWRTKISQHRYDLKQYSHLTSKLLSSPMLFINNNFYNVILGSVILFLLHINSSTYYSKHISIISRKDHSFSFRRKGLIRWKTDRILLQMFHKIIQPSKTQNQPQLCIWFFSQAQHVVHMCTRQYFCAENLRSAYVILPSA